MRLHRLTLQNFRQFRDEALEFAIGHETGNATVIHGQNGSGKTTLKNAFTWVLYGDVDFALRPDKLASQGAFAEIDPGDTITVKVILEFEHENVDYELTRRVQYQRQSETDFHGEVVDEEVELKYRTADGDRGSRDNPRMAIEQILPKRLSGLFFFDGEYINRLSEGRSQGDIQDAIQSIMGLTIIERSIRHLETVEGIFEEELQDYADTQLSEYIETRRTIKSEIEDLQRRLETKRESRDTLEVEIGDIDEKLEGMEDAAELQTERNTLQTELESIEDQVKDINERLEEAISKNAHLVFAMPAIQATANDIPTLRERDEIPSEVNNEFIEDLLARGECICGEPLEEGSEHYEQVLSYKSGETAHAVDQTVLRAISHPDRLESQRRDYFDFVDDLLDERSELRDQRTSMEERLDEIAGLLSEMDIVDPETGETPSELQAARERKVAEREDLIQEIGGDEARLSDKKERLESINGQIAEARQEEGQAELARKRMRAAESVRKKLEDSFLNLQQQVRTWSNGLVKDTFSKIATKEYEAEITEEFELRIRDQIANEYLEVDKSRGERQIASLTFIGSLVEIARERYEQDKDVEYFTGGIYPIVMDSPFGALDDEHRRQISRIIPQMAEQVVVFVTDSQWRGPVASELGGLAEKQYRLSYDPGDRESTFPRTRIIAEDATGGN